MNRTERYLLATSNHGLHFPNNAIDKPMQAYSDADFANDTLTRKSFSGTIYQLHGATIHWRAKQQSLVAQSTCEAEYIAAAETAQGAIWLRNMLQELNCEQTQPTPLYLDNSSAINIAQRTAPTNRRKCIDIKYHMIQDLVHNAAITVNHVPSRLMYADILTKPLKRVTFETNRGNLQVQPPLKQVQFQHPHDHWHATRASGGL